jgi:hypothetical protein
MVMNFVLEGVRKKQMEGAKNQEKDVKLWAVQRNAKKK